MSNEAWLFVGILAVWGIWIVWCWFPRWRFRRVFGQPANWNPKFKYLFQSEFVDPKLRELASKMNDAFQTEENQLRAIAEGRVRYKDAEQLTSRYAREVKASKQAFWAAHGLAKRFRFNIKLSYKEYLKPIH